MENKKILIIKIGSSTLLTKRFCVDEYRLSHIAQQIKLLQESGWNIVLVLSGAVASGYRFIDKSIHSSTVRRSAAAIGQVEIISKSCTIFRHYDIHIAQILLTKGIRYSRSQQKSIKEIVHFYFRNKIIPFFNENDVIDLYSFGGNDHLSYYLAKLLAATKVCILSSWKTNGFGVGGGEAKREVVGKLKNAHIDSIIIDGKRENCLLEDV